MTQHYTLTHKFHSTLREKKYHIHIYLC